jgi:putative hemolysin
MKRATILAAFAAALVFGVACGDDEESPTTTGVGLANPASVFCEEQGGTVEIVDETDGQVGYCNLPDGTRVEEWEYFTAMTGGTAP